jgi:lysyl-tRNA synthetase class II
LARTGIDVLALKTHDELVHAIPSRQAPRRNQAELGKQVDELFSKEVSSHAHQPTFIVDSNT